MQEHKRYIKGKTKKRSVRKSLGSMNYHVVTGRIKESNGIRHEQICSHQYSPQRGLDRYLIEEIGRTEKCTKQDKSRRAERISFMQAEKGRAQLGMGLFKYIHGCIRDKITNSLSGEK